MKLFFKTSGTELWTEKNLKTLIICYTVQLKKLSALFLPCKSSHQIPFICPLLGTKEVTIMLLAFSAAYL